MLIGIEASRANRREKTGVEWYAYHVIEGIKRLREAQNHSWLLYGNEPLSFGLERGPANWHEARLAWPLTYLWTQLRLSWEMMRHPPNVLFVPAHVLPRVLPNKSVVTVHDVGFHRRPDLYKTRQIGIHEWSTKDIARRASKMITVSEFSKREIVDCYKINPSRIFVTPLGIDHTICIPAPSDVIAETLARFHIPSPYLLFVGRVERKKNVQMLVDAFLRFKDARGTGDPTQLVLAGLPGKDFDALARTIAASSVRDAIHVTGYVTENEKAALMSGATALVHPSWYEGFGTTPLEAMACGTRVVCSHAASLPEVIGEENALWFDPSDTESLEHQLHTLVDHPEQSREMVARGQAWTKRYTWEQTAEATFSILTTW